MTVLVARRAVSRWWWRCQGRSVGRHLSRDGSGRHEEVHLSVDDYYRVTFEELDGEAVVVVAGEIDLTAQSRLHGVIDHARSGGQRLVIDLSETTFIDSSGLKVLLNTWVAQTEAGAEMVLRAPSPAVRTVIEMTGLQDVLPVEPGPDRSNDG